MPNKHRRGGVNSSTPLFQAYAKTAEDSSLPLCAGGYPRASLRRREFGPVVVFSISKQPA